jgi:prepilin-type N-terminal cleavage/methylation domain-containing protein
VYYNEHGWVVYGVVVLLKFMTKGFSLIEILVVIAVIAILAAVALPAYKAYNVRAKIAGAYAILNNVAAQQMVYYNKKGSFARAAQLGYATLDGGAWVNGSTLYPYARYFWFNTASGNCSDGTKIAEVTAQLDPSLLGLGASSPDVIFTIVVHDKLDGTVSSKCYARTDVGTNSNGAMTASMIASYLPSTCQSTIGNPTVGGGITTACSN